MPPGKPGHAAARQVLARSASRPSSCGKWAHHGKDTDGLSSFRSMNASSSRGRLLSDSGRLCASAQHSILVDDADRDEHKGGKSNEVNKVSSLESRIDDG